MGGKSARARQYVLLCFAFVALGPGCALFKPQTAPPRAPAAPPVVVIERLPPASTTPPPPPVAAVEATEPREAREADLYLQAAQQLMAKGEYESSLRETQKVLALAKDNPPADTAVFYMGLIHAHPNNPKKDNKKALGYFNRLVKAYPESQWAEQAKIWSGVLDGLEKLKQVDLELEERKRDRAR